MMALAIRLDHLIKTGQVSDQAELARVGHVSRARLTQIMDLNLLAPDIQEKILFLPQFATVSAIPTEQSVRKIAQTTNWHSQRHLWKADQS
ncbi:MAG TPA: hypothetical protein DDZ51_24285 [Planctomycetaceae bacterium]|nr:hypothetical protein [Planctomycetaceae bacterium]